MKNQIFILDYKDCNEALIKLNKEVPNMHLQVTTEAVGKYSPNEMRRYVYDVNPPGVSCVRILSRFFSVSLPSTKALEY